jgi:hypothetical protein
MTIECYCSYFLLLLLLLLLPPLLPVRSGGHDDADKKHRELPILTSDGGLIPQR